MDSHTHSAQVQRLEVVETGPATALVRGREASDCRGELERAAAGIGDGASVRDFAQPAVHVAAGFSCRADWRCGLGSRVRAGDDHSGDAARQPGLPRPAAWRSSSRRGAASSSMPGLTPQPWRG